MTEGVRLYGKSLGYGSLATVTRGFEGVLQKAGLLRGSYAVDEAEAFAEGEYPTDGADARYGVYVGPLACVGQMFEKGRHAEHFIMVTPNSDQLPRELVKRLAGYREKHSVTFMAPSSWASGIVGRHLDCDPITVPHGVSPEYHPDRSLADETRELWLRDEAFRVLHFSTSERQRKGTVELIQAWQHLDWRERGVPGTLLCVMDYPARLALEEAIVDGEAGLLDESVKVVDRAELPPDRMARSLCRSHVICQPSRGEGFGLIPLEALASGVPVVATVVTGHSEYLGKDTPGVVIIESSPSLYPIDDLPGSRAPRSTPEQIAVALTSARFRWGALHVAAQKGAHLWQSNWSWGASLAPFVKRLRAA